MNEDIIDVNRVFWMDQLDTYEAWRSIYLWRTSEQLESALLLKDRGQLLGAAVVCRAGFELAIAALNISAKLSKTLQLLDSENIRHSLCLSKTFPDDVELAIFGTKIPERLENEIPQQKNVLTYLDRLKSHENAGDIAFYYHRLCDVAHPSWLGNRAHYQRNNQGTISRVSQDYDPDWESRIRIDIDSTLSWTAHAAKNVMQQSSKAIQHARNIFYAV